MSIAVVLLLVETPLGDCTLAGEPPIEVLQRVAADLAPTPVMLTTSIDGIAERIETWLAAGIEQILLVRGDRPLLTTETLQKLLQTQRKNGTLPAILEPSEGVVSAGCVAMEWLKQRPFPLPSLDQIAKEANVIQVAAKNPAECLAVNSLPSLAEAESVLQKRINRRWMEAGVQITDPTTTYIHISVTIGPGTLILPNTHLWGQTTIGKSCRIGPNSIVRDSCIGDGCTITASVVEQAVMEDESDVGPFGHLRKGAHLGRGAHVGNFGEIKNSVLGSDSKMGHFGYLGDAIVGEDVNIGAGTITCNYDGVEKHQTIIEDGVFVGSDTMLIAPVRIGARARIGAASVVTRDVPADAVAYGVPARVKRSDKERGEVKDGEPSE